MYHSVSEVEYLRSRRVLAPACTNDSWIANSLDTFGASDRDQWLGMAAAIDLVMSVAFQS